MAAPPSYQEATRRLHWLEVVEPYVRFADYPSLCLVDRRCWLLFAPRLWNNLFGTLRFFGLDPGQDIAWWFHFVFAKLCHVTLKTRTFARILDAREFGKDAYHFASDHDAGLLTRSFQRALELLPGVNAVILDGHNDIDLDSLFSYLSLVHDSHLRLLSVAGCSNHVSNVFYSYPRLQKLVYLDVSGLPGSILPLLQPGVLQELRILKVRGREITDATLEILAMSFGRRLWSLDLTDNKLSDAAIDILTRFCLPAVTVRSRGHSDVEGFLGALPYGSKDYGPFFAIKESEWSSSFSHAERYQIDAPVYTSNAAWSGQIGSRSDGSSPLRSDELDDEAILLHQDEHIQTDVDVEEYRRVNGITHLHIAQNHISSQGIMKLLRTSGSHLEELDCGSMPLLPRFSLDYKHWPTSTSLRGIPGAADFFRPVFSSNLRALRIHHSFVTNVPTLEVDTVSHLERLYLAETSILPRVEEAYPRTFVPDMNPRLMRLTLTGIPRRSNGPLITKLADFIRLLAAQERAIQGAAAASSSRAAWRAPRLLQGLRCLELEFAPDPMEDGLSANGGLNAEEWMDSGEQGFSFFKNERPAQHQQQRRRRRESAAALWSCTNQGSHSSSSSKASDYHQPGVGRDTEDSVNYDGVWNGEPFSTPVWIGPRVSGRDGVLREYRHLAVDHDLRDCVGPAAPSQVLAGAPKGSCVFQTAWCAAVMPRVLETPAKEYLAGMRDVRDEIRALRRTAKARYDELRRKAQTAGKEVLLGEPHFFWTGTLRVSTAAESTLDDASLLWR